MIGTQMMLIAITAPGSAFRLPIASSADRPAFRIMSVRIEKERDRPRPATSRTRSLRVGLQPRRQAVEGRTRRTRRSYDHRDTIRVRRKAATDRSSFLCSPRQLLFSRPRAAVPRHITALSARVSLSPRASPQTRDRRRVTIAPEPGGIGLGVRGSMGGSQIEQIGDRRRSFPPFVNGASTGRRSGPARFTALLNGDVGGSARSRPPSGGRALARASGDSDRPQRASHMAGP